MDTWLTIVLAVLSGGVAAAFVQLLGHRREARTLRSQFLAPLGHMESLRWAGKGHGTDDVREAIHKLLAAAVVSRVPQDLVETYCAYAASAYFASEANFEYRGTGDPEDASIDREMSQPATDLAQLCADVIWRPVVGRWTYRERMWDIQRRFQLSGESYRTHTLARRHHVPVPPPPSA